MTVSLESMLAAAVASIGIGEIPPGSNVNVISQWYGVTGPWCDMSVTYWAYHTGNSGPVCFGVKHDYTVEHAQAFKNHGQWHVDVAGIQRGDIVFFDWAGTNDIAAIDHVGIVESVDADGVHTIEGNIDNMCKRMVRHADFIAGYGRPVYAPDVAPKPVPKPPATPPVPKLSLALVLSGDVKSVTLVQNALAKLGFLHTAQRGPYGPLTTAAYAAWQRSLGYSGADADGRPGIASLTKLGERSNLFTAVANFDPAPAPAPQPTPVPNTVSAITWRDMTGWDKSGTFGSGESACRSYASQALAIMGLPTSEAWLKGMATIAGRESAFNSPSWQINTTDSNAKNVPELFGGGNALDGHPGQCSRGGWQCIPQTFCKYHAAGTSTSIYDPVANVAASIRYVMDVYGVAQDGSNLAAKVQQADPNRPPRGY